MTERLGDSALGLGREHARYLGSVLRLSVGADVRLFNGRDGEWRYHITRIDRHGVDVSPVERRRQQVEEQRGPILLFAPLKRGPVEVLVQKATEMGVERLQPVITERTNRDQLKQERLATIAVEAAEQCERLSVPSLKPPIPLNEGLAPLSRFMFCDETAHQQAVSVGVDDKPMNRLDSIFGGASPKDGIALAPEAVLIGPEGGFTQAEHSMLRSDPRAVPISLGPRTLRAETAAVVGLTLWQCRFGDMV